MEKIITDGITLADFLTKMDELFDQAIKRNDKRKIAPITKQEACRRLGISDKTLGKVLIEMHIDPILPDDIDRILFRFPQYIRKSERARKIEID
jgi:hypothetical protein